MSTEIVQTPEPLNEYDLFRTQLQGLEKRAAEGAYGEPVLFLAGLEVEFAVSQSTDSAAALEWYIREKDTPDAQSKIKEVDLILPDGATADEILPPGEREELMFSLYKEAKAYIQRLAPKSDEERAKQYAWLKDIDNFTAADMVNFAVYREFSNPTLGETAPEKSATHAEMTEYGLRSDWLEFRFGTGILQEGYYDNEGVCELRLTPCPPTELIEREEIVMDRIARTALPLGALVRRGGRHINLSAYHAEYEDGQWSWRPIIGNKEANRAATLHVVAGLTAAIEDGAWMTKEQAQDYLLFGAVSGHIQRKISPVRSSIRIVDDYVELRDSGLITSTAHGLLWAMAGITHGLEQGALQLAKEGYTLPEIHERHAIERTANFDKERDLQLQRALESAELLDANGPFKMSNAQNVNRGHRLATDILGKEVIGDDKGAAIAFNSIVLTGLRIGDDGKLLYLRGNFEHAYNYLCEVNTNGEYAKAVKPLIDAVGFVGLEDAVCSFFGQDAVRVMSTTAIHSSPQYPTLNPEQWRQRWKDSPIMQRAYGDHLEPYAAMLANEAAKNYRDIDLRDPVQFAAVLQDLVARSQNN